MASYNGTNQDAILFYSLSNQTYSPVLECLQQVQPTSMMSSVQFTTMKPKRGHTSSYKHAERSESLEWPPTHAKRLHHTKKQISEDTKNAWKWHLVQTNGKVMHDCNPGFVLSDFEHICTYLEDEEHHHGEFYIIRELRFMNRC
ncbi:hypothetical protein O181_087744 [Austropuccinia psidii MF-1]|uniref:Uncharacterized protein n=1 Tax=Austropuccinia psidii MF-1 TaxID=1389203 RepID=A0A9Q3P274_9BASI|nr:hypothetical protein [Austropuccinia psidii MF-1]